MLNASHLKQIETRWARKSCGCVGRNGIILSGLRRAGKSTLLAQLAHRLGEDRLQDPKRRKKAAGLQKVRQSSA